MNIAPRLTPIRDTGIKIPRIVFGTSSLGNLYRAIPYATKREIISQWFEHSPDIVAIDSAGKYGAGLALETLARALAELDIKPTEVVISNKLGWRRVPLKTPHPTFEPGAWIGLAHDAKQQISYDGICRCWEQGCELLGDFRPQLVSVHDPDEYLAAANDDRHRAKRWDDICGAYAALDEMRTRGDVNAIGVGSKDWRVSRRVAEAFDIDWVMLATSLTVYSHDPELLEFIEALRARRVCVINSSVFHSGFLTGGEFFDYRKVTGSERGDSDLLDWRRRFHAICDRFHVQPAEACVAFGMSPPGVVAIALSSSRPNRIKINARLCSASPPSEFWIAMKEAALIRADYPYLAN